MSRVSSVQLLKLAADLGSRERSVVELVDRLRLVSHKQLAAMLDCRRDGVSEASAARAVRRVLLRLTELGLLGRLERRIGGIRAGSAGYVYYLGPVGQRLIAYWQGRGLVRGRVRPEPGGAYVRHRLAVSELYVQAALAERRGELELMAFDAEPDCWRTLPDGFGGRQVLKPDAFLRLGLGAYEDRYFVEVDLGTESRNVIRDKLRVYLAYYRSGAEQAEHGVFPRVVFLTTTEARKAAIVDECAALDPENWRIFTVTTLDHGLKAIAGDIEQAINDDGDDETATAGGTL